MPSTLQPNTKIQQSDDEEQDSQPDDKVLSTLMVDDEPKDSQSNDLLF